MWARRACDAPLSPEQVGQASKVNFNVSFNGLRKFTSSELLDAGFNMSVVSQRQGHGPQVLAKHYSKARESAQLEVLGRDVELQALHLLLASASAGRGGALVLSGGKGAGLTTLLGSAVEAAAGYRVISISAIEAEHDLAFAGLHALCVPVADKVGELPVAQRESIAAVLGLSEKPYSDRFVTGVAVLSLLGAVAEDAPLLCAVDDAQWLDQESVDALLFTARRLDTKPIAMVLALHEVPGSRCKVFAGLPEVMVRPLTPAAQSALLTSAARGPISDTVRQRLLAEAMGLPLALVELPRQLTTEQLAGTAALPPVLPLGDRLRQDVLTGLPELPEPACRLLLLAAAGGDLPASVVWAAAASMGVSPASASPAERAGLLRVGERLEIKQPLLRLAIYGDATTECRQEAHAALAAAIIPGTYLGQHARHRAAAALMPDEEVAGELEALANQARARADYATAAALFEQGASLTPELFRRAERLLASVQAAVVEGALDWATALLDRIEAQPLNDVQASRAAQLRAAIAAAVGQGTGRATELVQAARAFEPLDTHLARDTYLEAMEVAMQAGRFGVTAGAAEVAHAVRAAACAVAGEARSADVLLDALVALLSGGGKSIVAQLRSALEAIRATDEPRWLGLAGLAALEIWEDEVFHDLAARQGELPVAVAHPPKGLSVLEDLVDLDNVLAGRFDLVNLPRPSRFGTEVVPDAPVPSVSPVQVLAAAWRGLAAEARELAEMCERQAFLHELGLNLSIVQHAMAVLENSLGRYEECLRVAAPASEEPSLYVAVATLPEIVEGAARAGQRGRAQLAADSFRERVAASTAPWALGMSARCLALVTDGAEAEEFYQSAITQLRQSRVVPQLARAHLLYGEWLRRERRRRESREQLRTARDMFAFMGAQGFADRASRELAVTGEHLGTRSNSTTGTLTAQEEQVARLVAQGASNADIARKLFLSPRTVEYHLHKVFRKLGVSSRTQLAGVVLPGGSPSDH